jgi:anthranilate synthase component 1
LQFLQAVESVREAIFAGDAYQVVLSQRFQKPLRAHPFNLYRSLRTINPSPYMFFFSLGDERYVAGASPEKLVSVHGDSVETRPLAGTRRRGLTHDEDVALEKELRNDPKEKSEHVMLVDLGRNDLGRVSRPGSVAVERLMDVERYSHVMHLSSTVTGRLASGQDALDALRATFPAGTVSGAPKIRAMELIASLEPSARGVYAGALGYIGFGGNLDMAITLRTLVSAQGTVYAQAGAGIVADSIPENEAKEVRAKAQALFEATSLAEGMIS